MRRPRAGEADRDRPPLGADLDRPRRCACAARSPGRRGRPGPRRDRLQGAAPAGRACARALPGLAAQHVGPGRGQPLQQRRWRPPAPAARPWRGRRAPAARRAPPPPRLGVDPAAARRRARQGAPPGAPPASPGPCRARPGRDPSSALRRHLAAPWGRPPARRSRAAARTRGLGSPASRSSIAAAGGKPERPAASAARARRASSLDAAAAATSSGARGCLARRQGHQADPPLPGLSPRGPRRQRLAELGRPPQSRPPRGRSPARRAGIVEQRPQPGRPVRRRLRLAGGDQRPGGAQGLDERPGSGSRVVQQRAEGREVLARRPRSPGRGRPRRGPAARDRRGACAGWAGPAGADRAPARRRRGRGARDRAVSRPRSASDTVVSSLKRKRWGSSRAQRSSSGRGRSASSHVHHPRAELAQRLDGQHAGLAVGVALGAQQRRAPSGSPSTPRPNAAARRTAGLVDQQPFERRGRGSGIRPRATASSSRSEASPLSAAGR